MLIKKFYTKDCDLKKNLIYTRIFQKEDYTDIISFKFVRFIGIDKCGDLYICGIITDTHGNDYYSKGLGYELMVKCISSNSINIIIKEGYYVS